MAAVRSGVTPGCFVKCFFRQTGKPRRGPRLLSNSENHRSHLHTVFQCIDPATRPLLGRTQHRKLWVGAVAVRHMSSQIQVETASPVVPEAASSAPPSVFDSSPDFLPTDITSVISQTVIEQVTEVPPTVVEVLQAAVTEPSLAELGLAAYTPVGLIQNLLEFIHVDLGLPWWGAIVAGTVLVRLAMFPIIVKGQKEMAKLNNVMPEMNKLNEMMNDAKQSGNKYELQKMYATLMICHKKHDISPLRAVMLGMVQASVFMSFFISLRNMAYLPVPSLQTGGALWFPDLTVADPFYILPLALSGSLLLVVERGTKFGVDFPNLRGLKTVFRFLAVVMFPASLSFPTAILTYWLTFNCFSLGQLTLLQLPSVRKKLKFPEMVEHPPTAMPSIKVLFSKTKEALKNAKQAQQLEERERRLKNRLDVAGRGPLRQISTHNPMQQTPPVGATAHKAKAVAEKTTS